MKKVLSCILVFVLILALAGCGAKDPALNEANGGAAAVEAKQSENTGDLQQLQNESAAGAKTLPTSYPKESLPLAADAEIIDVRENPASKGLEVMYVSDNDIGTLRDFYEGALKDAKDLSTVETSDGYMVSANMDGVGYTIMISKDAMNPNPQYAGKISVYIILSGLEGISGGGPQMPEEEGEAWPTSDLPGVPQLKGHISQILREDGIIRLEIRVENAGKVKSYIGELTAAGFSFDTQPDIESSHMEFLAFKDSSMMSFAYKGEENLVSIEYQK
jgi:predicted small lipoprotein YifL